MPKADARSNRRTGRHRWLRECIVKADRLVLILFRMSLDPVGFFYCLQAQLGNEGMDELLIGISSSLSKSALQPPFHRLPRSRRNRPDTAASPAGTTISHCRCRQLTLVEHVALAVVD